MLLGNEFYLYGGRVYSAHRLFCSLTGRFFLDRINFHGMGSRQPNKISILFFLYKSSPSFVFPFPLAWFAIIIVVISFISVAIFAQTSCQNSHRIPVSPHDYQVTTIAGFPRSVYQTTKFDYLLPSCQFECQPRKPTRIQSYLRPLDR
jgi:hypothetical protein